MPARRVENHDSVIVGGEPCIASRNVIRNYQVKLFALDLLSSVLEEFPALGRKAHLY